MTSYKRASWGPRCLWQKQPWNKWGKNQAWHTANASFCPITSVNACIQMFAAICVDLLPPRVKRKYKWSPDTMAELAGGVRKVTRLHALFNGAADRGSGPAGGRPEVLGASPLQPSSCLILACTRFTQIQFESKTHIREWKDITCILCVGSNMSRHKSYLALLYCQVRPLKLILNPTLLVMVHTNIYFWIPKVKKVVPYSFLSGKY